MSLRRGTETTHIFGNASTGTIALVSAVANQRVYLYRMIVTITTPSISLVLQDTSGAPLSQNFQLAVQGAIVLDVSNNYDPWWISNAGLGMQFVQSGTTNVSYDVWYIQGP